MSCQVVEKTEEGWFVHCETWSTIISGIEKLQFVIYERKG